MYFDFSIILPHQSPELGNLILNFLNKEGKYNEQRSIMSICNSGNEIRKRLFEADNNAMTILFILFRIER